MGQARGAEPRLRHLHAAPHLQQAVLVGDFHIGEFQLAMAAMFFRPHDRHFSHQLEAGRVLVHHEGGELAARFIGSAGNEDEMIGDAGAGNEPFMAVDNPLVVAFWLSRGADHGRVGAAAGMRLGHDDGAARLAVDDRLQPFFLLRLGAQLIEHAHIAIVGRGAVETDGTENRIIGFFIHDRLADEGQPHAAALFWHLRAPQALRLHPGANLVAQVEADIFMFVIIAPVVFKRRDMRRDEGARALAHIFNFVRQGKIDHGSAH